MSLEEESHEAAHAAVYADEPKTFEEAMQRDDSAEWKAAMDLEMKAMMDNGTWDMVPLPPGAHVMGCKWVLSKKRNSDGSLDRYKARVVAKGYTQEQGIDYNETFAPTLRYETLRVLLALAAAKDMAIDHIDISNAFLNGTMKETVYMQQPPGYETGGADMVCRLVKTIYGTKQAGNEWNNELNGFMLASLGFTRCKSDSCVYVKKSRTNQVITAGVFVDDILPFYLKEDQAEWMELKALLMAKYKARDMGSAHWVLGMTITRDRDRRTIHIGHELYLTKVIKEFGMDTCNATRTPAEGTVLSIKGSPATIEEGKSMNIDVSQYRAMVGSLMYASISTRWDLAQSVGALTRYMQNPGTAHVNAAKRVLRYIKGTLTRGLEYNGLNRDGTPSTELTVTAYADADWASERHDCKSITGYMIKVNDCVVSWASKKQATVALSTAESEYYAISAATQQLIWTKQLLGEVTMGMSDIKATIKTDSQSAMAMTSKDNMHNRTKHIDIKHHFVRDHIKKKTMQIQWVPTHHQLADILTKPLPKIQYERMRDRINDWREGDQE